MKTSFWAFIIFLFLCKSPMAFSQNSIEQYYIHFKQGQFKTALETLESLKPNDASDSTIFYLKAVTLSRLQEFDLSLNQYEKAIASNNQSPDLFYEYGQALYAANEIKKAREAFRTSVQKKFNVQTSLYYVAHISQILEEFEISKDIYLGLIKDKNLDTNLKQISHFQLCESLLSIARIKFKNPQELSQRVEKFILPMLETAYAVDKSTDLARDIQARKNELYNEFKLDPNLLANGRRLPSKRFTLSLSQSVKFDDNITLSNGENDTQQTQKESFVFTTEAYSKYDFVLKKMYVMSPEIRITQAQHSDRSSPEVYQNDSFLINANLKNKLEHQFKNQPASLLFDLEFSQVNKDWNQKKKKELYASSLAFSIGESFNLFSFGETTLKLKYKNYKGENTDISNKTTSLSVDQTYYLPKQQLLIFLFDFSSIDNFNLKSSSTDTYLLRFDYILPEIFPDYTLSIALATTVTDTKQQKEARGTEMNYNPSIEVSKQIGSNMKTSLTYDMTKSKSKTSSYAYDKSSLALEFQYNF